MLSTKHFVSSESIIDYRFSEQRVSNVAVQSIIAISAIAFHLLCNICSCFLSNNAKITNYYSLIIHFFFFIVSVFRIMFDFGLKCCRNTKNVIYTKRRIEINSPFLWKEVAVSALCKGGNSKKSEIILKGE